MFQVEGYQPYREVVFVPGDGGPPPDSVAVDGAVRVEAEEDGRFVVGALDPGEWEVCVDSDEEGRPTACLDTRITGDVSQISAAFGGEMDNVAVFCRGEDRSQIPELDGTCPQ